jgi:hypothetical protein
MRLVEIMLSSAAALGLSFLASWIIHLQVGGEKKERGQI